MRQGQRCYLLFVMLPNMEATGLLITFKLKKNLSANHAIFQVLREQAWHEATTLERTAMGHVHPS